MVFGVKYRVVGRADCPYFARAERLATMLKQKLQLHESDIIIESIHPDEWSTYSQKLCGEYGFTSFISSQAASHSPDHVLAFNPATRRLVGGENAFRKELSRLYAVECDVEWAHLRAMAREEVSMHAARREAAERRARMQPLLLSLVGAPGSGKSSLCRALSQRFGVVRVSSGEMLRQIVSGKCTSHSLSEPDVSLIRSCMLAGELVPDRLVLPLLAERLGDDDVRARGAVLDGWPRTEAQAHALRDMERRLAPLSALLVLSSLDDATLARRVEGRRIDPESGEIYHVTDAIPPSALVLSRLERRLDDERPTPAVQLRAHRQNEEDVLRVFAPLRITHDVSSEGSMAAVLTRAALIVEPLAESFRARRAAGEAERAQQLEQQLEAVRHPPPPTPFAAPMPAPSSSPLASPLTPVTPRVEDVAEAAARGASLPPSRRGSLNAGAAGGSKPSSRRGSIKASEGAPPLHGEAASRGSMRRSARASAGAPLVPAAALRATPATAVSSVAPPVQRVPSDSGAARPTSARPTSARPTSARPTSARPTPARPTSAHPARPASQAGSRPASAQAEQEQEDSGEIQLHKRRGSGRSRGGSGALAGPAGTMAPIDPSAPLEAAAAMLAHTPAPASQVVVDHAPRHSDVDAAHLELARAHPTASQLTPGEEAQPLVPLDSVDVLHESQRSSRSADAAEEEESSDADAASERKYASEGEEEEEEEEDASDAGEEEEEEEDQEEEEAEGEEEEESEQEESEQQEAEQQEEEEEEEEEGEEEEEEQEASGLQQQPQHASHSDDE